MIDDSDDDDDDSDDNDDDDDDDDDERPLTSTFTPFAYIVLYCFTRY